VVRVIVDHDLIAIPEPIVAVAVIGLRNTEEESTKPKTLWAASRKAEDMTLTDAPGKSSMFERPVEMVPRIIAARVMPDPLVVCVNVGRFWMSGSIRKTTICRRGRLLSSRRLLNSGWLLRSGRLSSGRLRSSGWLNARRRRTVRGDVSTTNATHTTAPRLAAPFLCKSRGRRDRQQNEENNDWLQGRPP
jgi:hypothetical protein